MKGVPSSSWRRISLRATTCKQCYCYCYCYWGPQPVNSVIVIIVIVDESPLKLFTVRTMRLLVWISYAPTFVRSHLLRKVAEALEDGGITALSQLLQLDVSVQPAVRWISSESRQPLPSRTLLPVEEDLGLWTGRLLWPHDHLVHLLLDLLVEKPENWPRLMYSALGAEFSVLLIAVNNISSAKLTKAKLGKGRNGELSLFFYIFDIFLWNILNSTLNQRIQRADEQALSRMAHLLLLLFKLLLLLLFFLLLLLF